MEFHFVFKKKSAILVRGKQGKEEEIGNSQSLGVEKSEGKSTCARCCTSLSSSPRYCICTTLLFRRLPMPHLTIACCLCTSILLPTSCSFSFLRLILLFLFFPPFQFIEICFGFDRMRLLVDRWSLLEKWREGYGAEA